MQELGPEYSNTQEEGRGKYFSQAILCRSEGISLSILEIKCATEIGIKWQQCAGTILLATF